jgi:phosphatidylethanolamine/phosphatidyl-N-methylethanolamine N-methyltransferase
MNCLEFFKEFVAYPKITGAITPSSERLSELITNIANLPEAESVIEFGSGTGVFTEKILKKLPPKTNFIAIESNANFVAATKSRCPQVTICHDNAIRAKKILQIHGLSSCDCIISGLPWASFDKEFQNQLLDIVFEILSPGGKFVTFAYLHGLILTGGINFRNKVQSSFSKVTTTKPVWLNTPPAFVYCAQK